MSFALETATDDDVAALKWYYKIELKPGAFTNGGLRTNMVPNRTLIDRIDFSGMKVLDIGAQEGAFSVLLSRAGAKVTGYDRFDMSDKINIVQQAYGTRFKYVCGLPFPKFVQISHRREDGLFDGIFFSGVLYHVIAPTHFVHLVRTMLNPGGVLILETVTAIDPEAALYFNADERFWKGHGSYYVCSSGWLDGYLRFLGFRIVDVEFTTPRERAGKKISRVALTAVLTDGPVAAPGDTFARHLPQELAEFQPVKAGAPPFDGEARVKPALYEPDMYHQGIEPRTLDVTKVVMTKRPVPRSENLQMLELA